MASAKRRKGRNGAVSSTEALSDEDAETVIIDTDPGVDDSMALLLALAPHDKLEAIDKRLQKLNVIGLTIVHGNSSDMKQLGKNACAVLDIAGRPDIPVYIGAGKPLIAPHHGGAPHVHGVNGIGDVETKEPSTQPVPPSKCTAAEYIVKTVRENPGKISIIALGPLTNIAAALVLEPRLPKLTKRLVVMAGAVGQPGNVTRLAEANVWNDPESAHMVFNPAVAWASPLIQITLNLTQQFIIDDAFLQEVKTESHVGEFVWDITRFYVQFFRESFKQDYMFVHDSSCVLALLAPFVFKSHRMLNIDVECDGKYTRGVTVGDVRTTSQNRDANRDPNVQMMDLLDCPEAKRVMRECYKAYASSGAAREHKSRK